MIKKILTLIAFGFTLLVLTGCQSQDTVATIANTVKQQKGFISEKNNSIKIGIEDEYYFSFEKVEDNWTFSGVYAGEDDSLIFESLDSDFYRFGELEYNRDNPETIFDTNIENVEVITNDDTKIVKVSNDKVSLNLVIEEDSLFIKRIFEFNNTVENALSDYQLSFTLRTNPEVITREYGAIGTMEPSVVQAEIPYAFPAVYTKLFTDDSEYNVINVIDYQNSNPVFGNIRKRNISDQFEIGATSAYSVFGTGVLTFIDYWSINQESKTYFELIGEAADQYLKINPMQIDDLSNKDNLVASSFSSIVDHLYEDIMDTRSGFDLYNGAITPYAYMEDHGGWGEAFATLDVSKGMLRYAMAKDDSEMTDEIIDIVKAISDTGNGVTDWIVPYDGQNAVSGEYYLHFSYAGGIFYDNSSGEETGTETGISGWKYYDMLANLADLAYLSDDESIKESFLQLMPFLNSLKMDDYSQPVAWYFETREPVSGHDNGGSAGNASMWAYIHLMSSQIGDNDYYLEEGLNALDHANSLDYFSMTSMRVAVKQVAIGWNVRANMLAYDLTGDETYLNEAKIAAKSILSFYYLNSNPLSYFSTIGFGYAGLKERWEAYLEMSEGLWLILPVMEYMTDDKTLLDVMYAASKTYVYAFPINGTPYGNYQRVPGYDSLDGYYIPFEFTTGVLVDSAGTQGGSQSSYRQTKEIYGAGEGFLSYLMFEGYAYSPNESILVLNTGNAQNNISQSNQKFILYNASSEITEAVLLFRYLEDGDYSLIMNDIEVGTYSKEQLLNGINIGMDARESITIEIEKV